MLQKAKLLQGMNYKEMKCDVIILALGFGHIELPWYDRVQTNTTNSEISL